MTVNELLMEAKAKLRDTKGTRDNLTVFLFGAGLTPKTEAFLKDAGKVNSLVAFVAQNVLGKKKAKNGKFIIGDADLKKLEQLKFTVNDLSPTLAKALGETGSQKYMKAKVETTTKSTTTSTPAPAAKSKELDKDTIIADIEKIIDGKKSGNQVSWEKDDRVTHRDALRTASRQASGLSKYFDMNKTIDEDEGTDYNDPEWGGYDQRYAYEVYAPKAAYKDILKKVTVGGKETGDYAGDWADAYIYVYFN